MPRRKFITGLGVGLVAGAVVGAAIGALGFPETITKTATQTATQTTTLPAVTNTQTQTVTSTATTALGVPASWDYQADIVVMGGGTSGLSAAIEAANAGAKVIVLEKYPSTALANSGHCAGTLSACGTPQQAALGITDSPTQYYNELIAQNNARANPALLQLIANNGAAAIAWLTTQGITWQSYTPLLDGQSTAPRMMACAPDSSSYPKTLTQAASKAGVQFLYSTPGKALIRDPVNGVIGVTATGSTNNVVNVKANRAVVVAAGDQAANTQMLGQFGPSPSWLATLPPEGSAGSTGDGIIAAMAVGAAPMCLDTNLTSPAFGFIVGNTRILPDTSYGYAANSTNPNAKLSAYAYQPAILSYSIYVNNAGQRYTNEMGSTVASDTLALPGMKSFMIFDSTPANVNVVMHISAGHTYFKEWLADGVLTQADTIAGLATALGIDPAGLTAMVTKWNGYVAAKSDPDFKRTTFVSPISVGPFYGIQATLFSLELANGTLNVAFPTLQVLDEAGNVIPRLYAAGDCGKSGQMGGGHGTHMIWTFISGRLAGTNAAAEKPLS